MVDFRTQQHSYFGSSNNPSFSSSLLDAIYRSIDLGEDESAVAVNYWEEEDIMKKKKKQSYGDGGGVNVHRTEVEMANFRRACMIEKWMEKKVNDKANIRRKPVNDDLNSTKKLRKVREINSSSSSSDSSGYGFFSSSEAESTFRRPNPIRTGCSKEKAGGEEPEKSRAGGGSFFKTKSRALKLYSDFKKAKQPVSPGGRLTGFLNALFAGGIPKKHSKSPESTKSANASSTCSSASSFSRSCLSKTPSSWKSKASSGKRSVRFSPVSVIVDENSFHQSDDKNQTPNFVLPRNNDSIESSMIRSVIKEELMAKAMEKNRRVEEAARDLLRNYHRKSNQFEYQIDQLRKTQMKNHVFDDEDAGSCASSDLFELDNLSGIGMEELPVYETTHLGSCRINGGLIL